MGQVRVGDKVEIVTGKRQGNAGTIIEIAPDGMLILTVEGVPYDVSYRKTDVKVTLKASKADDAYHASLNTPAVQLRSLHGEKKRKLSEYLVKQRMICPSFPYSCTGACGVNEETDGEQ